MPYKLADRRSGDIDACYGDCSKALEQLGWKSKYDMLDACRDTWRWQSKYPFGFQTNNNNNVVSEDDKSCPSKCGSPPQPTSSNGKVCTN